MPTMGDYGKVVQDAGNMERVPSAGNKETGAKRGKTHARQ